MASLLYELQQRGVQLKRKTAGEYSSPCPFCGGVDRFCVWPEENRYWCRQCDKKGDTIQLLIDLDGLTFQEAAEKTGKVIDVPETKNKDNPEIIATYDYHDETGKVLFQTVRYDPKDFKQRKPDGKGGWIWNVRGVRLVLYRLPQVIKYKDIFYCEGEKDVHTLETLGFTATTNPRGANKLPGLHKEHKILNPLKDKNIYILPDNDKAGKEHSEQTAILLQGIANTVKIIELPGLPQKGDVSDYFKEHGADASCEKLTELISSTHIWTPPKNFYSINDIFNLKSDNHIPVMGRGIMPYNSHIIIAGESGVGKSMLRNELAIHIAMGWNWLEDTFEIPHARKVVIFQYENSEITEKTRLKRMCDGLGITNFPEQNLKFVNRKNRINLTLKGDREKLYQLVKESEGEVIIYDCLSNIHTSKENDNIQMRDILDTLSDINARANTACILIHHFGKPGEGNIAGKYRVRGASTILDWPYTIMTFMVKNHEHRILRKLEITKVRDGPEPKPLILERDENFLCKIIDDYSIFSPSAVADLLLDLGGRVESQAELMYAIVDKIGCGERTARKYIQNAIRMRSIYAKSEGRKKVLSYTDK